MKISKSRYKVSQLVPQYLKLFPLLLSLLLSQSIIDLILIKSIYELRKFGNKKIAYCLIND